jgi:hypothetical protein
LRDDIEAVAVDANREALERRLGESQRRAGADVPLPQVLMTGEHRAVVQAFAQRHFLVRTHRLIGVVIVSRVDHQELHAVLRLALDHAVGWNAFTRAYEALVHRIN